MGVHLVTKKKRQLTFHFKQELNLEFTLKVRNPHGTFCLIVQFLMMCGNVFHRNWGNVRVFSRSCRLVSNVGDSFKGEAEFLKKVKSSSGISSYKIQLS
jgi:hypothetical protein